MKVEFHFSQNPLEWDVNYLDELKLDIESANASIRKKVEEKVISICCMPSKGMLVNLLSFSTIFGFTEKEIEMINGGNHYYLTIVDLILHPEHLEVVLEPEYIS